MFSGGCETKWLLAVAVVAVIVVLMMNSKKNHESLVKNENQRLRYVDPRLIAASSAASNWGGPEGMLPQGRREVDSSELMLRAITGA